MTHVRVVLVGALAAPLVLGCGGGNSTPTGSGGAAGAGSGSGGAAGKPAIDGGQDGASCASFTGKGFAVLGGPALGAGTVAAGSLRKSITARDRTASPLFTVGAAWVVDPTERDIQSYNSVGEAYVTLTNRSTSPVCFVQMTSIVYRNAAGTDVTASYGVSSAAIGATVHDTAMQCTALRQGVSCLAPGQTTWARQWFSTSGRATVNDIDIASMEFSLAGQTGQAVGDPDFGVMAQFYTVDTPAGATPQVLHINLKNTGSAAAMLGSIYYFILDAQGTPLDAGVIVSTLTLAPGQTTTLDSDFVFDGAATRLWVAAGANRVLQ